MTAVEVLRGAGGAPARPDVFDPTRFGLGVVVPVLGAHPQAGASGIALALADAAAGAGLRVLLLDCADPARSGLAGVCAVEGRSVPGARGRAGIRPATRQLRRGVVTVRRIAATGEPLDVRRVPLPAAWIAADDNHFDLTVVDAGWDAWSLLATGERLAPLLWCTGSATFPVLVLRPTIGSAGLAEGTIARYDDAVRTAGLVPLYATVVVGARTWPATVVPVLGHRLAQRRRRTLFAEATAESAVSGWTTGPAPPASLRAATVLLRAVTGAAPSGAAPTAAPARPPQRRPGWLRRG
ncbi:hypothetical protein KZZ52_27705 [Dactylosporangium sp. AC04546]|uniref:hypothetical protein n=1 Tax=Dactylosporangium sp. AC04546 TaxID=2862460 RepID=UPI001EE0F0E1|nr:hypothetical protein [Dactylosporangium sp. AC04546]WVK89053.1 hypothetical protein KZZ52_27705 [Dactylosporangium sp. AC04546]